MRNHKLRFEIVLCLVMLVRRSIQDVQRLDTGYLYPVGEKGNGRQKDLKCAFWYSGKVHIQLTKLLLQLDGPVPSTLNTICDFQKNTIIHLAVLYNLKTERIGALWLVHLYVNKVVGYYKYLVEEYNYPNDIIVEKMSVTHDYIIRKLQSETVDHCTEGNRFDWSRKQFAGMRLSAGNVRALIEQNTREMNELLEKNNLTAYVNTDDYKVSNVLLLNDRVWESFNNTLLNDVNVFYTNVHWENTKKLFASKRNDTCDLDFASNNFRPIKSYMSTVFAVLKVIVMRMSWKFLTFVRHASLTNRPFYAKKWLYKLQDFACMCYLGKDVHVDFLLGAFNDHRIQNTEFIDLLIGYVQRELITLSAPLSCDATRPFALLFGNNYNPENHNHIDQMIKKDSLVKANILNSFLKDNIVKYDFGVTWALLNYIDEPEPYELFG